MFFEHSFFISNYKYIEMKISDYINLDNKDPINSKSSKLFNIDDDRCAEILDECRKLIFLKKIKILYKYVQGAYKGNTTFTFFKYTLLEAVQDIECNTISEMLLINEIAAVEATHLELELEKMSGKTDPAIINKLFNTINDTN